MTANVPLTYDSYIQLDVLLAIQRPLTPPDISLIWAAERFFIVCHQASELWQSQLLVDIEQAAGQAQDGDWAQVRASLRRVTSIALLLSVHLDQFYHLPREHFLRFRPALAGVSGAESRQFRELLQGARHPHIRSLRLRLSEELRRRGQIGHYACDHDACGSARELDAFVGTVMAWRGLHVKIADRLIQDLGGTGGTSGVAYLRRRLADSGEEPIAAGGRRRRSTASGS